MRPVVPIDTTRIKTLYVFVEIAIDQRHLVETVRLNLPSTRGKFHSQILSNDASSSTIQPGTQIGPAAPLRLEAAPHVSDSDFGPRSAEDSLPTRLAIVSTIQFVAAIQRLKDDLSVSISEDPAPLAIEGSGIEPAKDATDTHSSADPTFKGIYEATIPRSKPLSPGEILGCTAPRLPDTDALMYAVSSLRMSFQLTFY